jgi:hypothetical protein
VNVKRATLYTTLSISRTSLCDHETKQIKDLEDMRRDVRILLVGDGLYGLVCFRVSDVDPIIAEGVGKSTIVTSLIKEAFVARVCITPIIAGRFFFF